MEIPDLSLLNNPPKYNIKLYNHHSWKIKTPFQNLNEIFCNELIVRIKINFDPEDLYK